MSRFARLSVVVLAATYVLIALGGFVRAKEAGLGCPDWPTCYGHPNPPGGLSPVARRLAWIEHSHRLWAGLLVVLICTLAVAAWRSQQSREVRLASYLLVPAVLSQALLGAVVIWLKLDASSVVLHLAGALTVLALATYVVLRATGRGFVDVGDPGVVLLARATAAAVFAQLLLGSSVTGWGAGLALPGASFANAVGPRHTIVLQVAHRLLALTIAGLAAVLAWRVRRIDGLDPLARALALALPALVVVQIGLGVSSVLLKLPAGTVVPHLAVASWIWGVSVALVLRISADPQRAGVRELVPSPA